MSLIALLTLLVGLWLVVLAFRRLRHSPAQAMGLFLGALLLNSWWLVLLGMSIYKFYVLKQDT